MCWNRPTAVAYAGFWKRGGQKLQNIWEEHTSEFEIVILKFRPIYLSKSGEEKKKSSSLKFCPSFLPKSGEEQKKKKKVFTQISSHVFEPYLQTLMPNLQRGGAHASILLTFLCNFAILATQRGAMAQWPPPPKYAPGLQSFSQEAVYFVLKQAVICQLSVSWSDLFSICS